MTTANSHIAYLAVLGCTFLGPADVVPYSGEFADSAFIGAHLNLGFEGYAMCRSNAFTGSGEYAIRVAGEPNSACITGNSISGAVSGIALETPGIDVTDNEVSHCSGSAIVARGYGSGLFYRNHIYDCDGHGIDVADVPPMSDISGNVIERVGGDGIHSLADFTYSIRSNEIRHTGGHGILASAVAHEVTGNVVLDTGADGISIESAASVDSNIVGRAAGRGI